MRRGLIVLLAIALGAAGYWLFGGGGGEEHERSQDLAGSSARGVDDTALPSETGPASMPPSPLRMRGKSEQSTAAVTPIASAVSLAEAFAQEPLHAPTAVKQSEQVRSVVEELTQMRVGSARIEKLECRALHCKLRLASDDPKALVQFVDALQDDRGFLGKAESIMMSREEDDMILYLRFPPPK